MDAPDFSDFSTALATALRLTKRSDSDGLTELLYLSAGKVDDTDMYRPYFAAARWLEDNPRWLISGEGATFTGLNRSIRSLMLTQRAIDVATGTTVPLEWQAMDLVRHSSVVPLDVSF